MFDGHIHIWHKIVDGKTFQKRLTSAGVNACVLISQPPVSFECTYHYLNYKQRLINLMQIAKDKTNIFPFFFIDPTEDNIFDQIDRSIEHGVRGFKAVCTHYYPYEDRVMRVWDYIAKAGKPIIFHSGILYNDRASSKFNRPCNFEELFYVDGLRFSLAHIGWPWIDEMIAVFGKWNFFYQKKNFTALSDMYIDLTPGTPKIYREDAIRKLLTVGYSMMSKRIYWGSDGNLNYKVEKYKERIDSDRKILHDLVTVSEQKSIMDKNIRTFIGENR